MQSAASLRRLLQHAVASLPPALRPGPARSQVRCSIHRRARAARRCAGLPSASGTEPAPGP
eukprot:scaffold1222_cov330-Prasinococcus_capsulatus_cf.AAC.8